MTTYFTALLTKPQLCYWNISYKRQKLIHKGWVFFQLTFKQQLKSSPSLAKILRIWVIPLRSEDLICQHRVTALHLQTGTSQHGFYSKHLRKKQLKIHHTRRVKLILWGNTDSEWSSIKAFCNMALRTWEQQSSELCFTEVKALGGFIQIRKFWACSASSFLNKALEIQIFTKFLNTAKMKPKKPLIYWKKL